MIKKILVINLILIALIYYLPNKKLELKETISTKPILTEVTSRSDKPRKLENKKEEKKEVIEDKTLQGYRVTSYYTGDSCITGTKTGSGKTTNDFSITNINGKHVYTYQGKIVVAGATKELLKSGYNKNGSQNKQNKHYFSYGDTGRIKLNDTWYGFIVLDSCGASMWEGYYRIDIFVPSSNDVIDTKDVKIIYD